MSILTPSPVISTHYNQVSFFHPTERLVDTLYFIYLYIYPYVAFLYVLFALPDCKLSAGDKETLNIAPDTDFYTIN